MNLLRRPSLLGLLVATVTLGASCPDRDPQPPFLCCVLTCTGGLIRARKDAPRHSDAGWVCQAGQPIDYNGSCTAEDGSECEDPTNNASGGGGNGGGSSAQGASSSGGVGSSRGSSLPASSSG